MKKIERLIEKINKGEKEALEELIKILAPIRRSLEKRFPYLDPEDLDQDLILLTIEALKNYKKEASNFFYYIKNLSTWYCLDKIKGLKYEESLNQLTETGEEKIDSLEGKANIEEEIEKEEERRIILAAIKSLDKKEAYLIYSYYYKGNSLKEIGEKLKISPATISRLHKKAVRNLKKKLL